MKNGLDPREFTARLKKASPEERAGLIRDFQIWIKTGEKAQGFAARIAFSFGAVGLSSSAIVGVNSVWSMPVIVSVILAGVLVLYSLNVCVKRERAWREANPFYDWRAKKRTDDRN